jgi:hypothetical protein
VSSFSFPFPVYILSTLTSRLPLLRYSEMFSNLFGGEAFVDLVGEISMIKDFMGQAEVMMYALSSLSALASHPCTPFTDTSRLSLRPRRSDEERAEMEREMGTATAPPADKTDTPPVSASGVPLTETTPTTATPAAASGSASTSTTFPPSPPTASLAEMSLQSHLGDKAPTASGSSTPSSTTLSSDPSAAAKKGKKGAKPELTDEQRAKLQEMETAKEAARVERIKTLEKKLLDRIRPFVEAKNPGDKADEETKRFEQAQRLEADDLKLESFGIEVGRCSRLLPPFLPSFLSLSDTSDRT